MNSDKWDYMEKGNQSPQMKKGKGGGEVNESLLTRIQCLHICDLEFEKSLDALGNKISWINSTNFRDKDVREDLKSSKGEFLFKFYFSPSIYGHETLKWCRVQMGL